MKLRKILLWGVPIALVAWLGSSAIVTWKLTHRSKAPFFEPVPEALRERIEELRLSTRDGQTIGAWWLAVPDACAVALVLHGNGGSRTSMRELVERLADLRVASLALSLRAHGDSTGETNDFGWSARADVVAGVELVEGRCAHTPIVIIGQSLGAATAIYAARELDTRVAGYLLEAPYRDLASATQHRLSTFLPALLDRLAYAGMLLVSPLMLAVPIDELSPLERVADIPAATPVVLLSGALDRYSPLAEIQEIAARAGEHACLVVFEGTGHTDLFLCARERYEGGLQDLLTRIEAHGSRERASPAEEPVR